MVPSFSVRGGRDAAGLSAAACGATTGLVSVPTPSYVHVMRSPAFSRIGGLRAEPTPGGVPVAITSPGRSVMMLLA